MQLMAAGAQILQAGCTGSRYACQNATQVLRMSSVSSLNPSTTASAVPSPAAPANASAELAKYESQLSDWVHCASSKTSAGQAKIAEITDKIEAIKTQVKRAEDARPKAPEWSTQDAVPAAPQRQLRLDQLGTWLDAQA